MSAAPIDADYPWVHRDVRTLSVSNRGKWNPAQLQQVFHHMQNFPALFFNTVI